MTVRLLQSALLLIVALAAWVTWRDLPLSRPVSQSADAQARLALEEEVFGHDVIAGSLVIDLVDGIEIKNLHVPSKSGRYIEREDGTIAEGFHAAEVRVRHDILALAAGHLEVKSLDLSGASIVLVETQDGLNPDFPFDLIEDEGTGGGPIPRVEVRDAALFLMARDGSTRLADGGHVAAQIDVLIADPQAEDRVDVSGQFRVLDIAHDDEIVQMTGTGNPLTDALDISAEWTRLEIGEELLGLLHPTIAGPLRQNSIQSGRLKLQIHSQGGTDPIHLRAEWDADVEVQVEDIPGIEQIDARTKEQLQELFGRGILKLSVDDDVVNIESLVSQMAGGYVQASGSVTPETGELELAFRILDLDLRDPAVRRALGPDGAALFETFRPAGIVTAEGKVTRDKDGNVEWKVDVELHGASFEYRGTELADGSWDGFPYRVLGARGTIHLRPEGVFFDDIRGYHRGTDILLRGNQREAWTGGPTGRILFEDAGPDIRLTIEAVNLAIDEDVNEAIAGSEFKDIWDELKLSGSVDRAEIDIISDPEFDDAAVVEFRLELAGEQFTYVPFPYPVEDVIGTIVMRRPRLEVKGKHGNIYQIDVRGWAEGAPVRVFGAIEGHAGTGLLQIHADGIPLGGRLTEAVLASDLTREALEEAWTWLAPRGRATVTLDLPIGDDPRLLQIEADFVDASMRIGAVHTVEGESVPNEHAIEIDNLIGRLAYVGGKITFRKGRGLIGTTPVELSGEMDGGTDGTWNVDVQTERLDLSRRLIDGLRSLVPEDELFPGGLRLEPGGRVRLDLKLEHSPESDGLQAQVTLFDLDLLISTEELEGIEIVGERVEIAEDWIDVKGVTARGPHLEIDAPRARIPKTDDGHIEGRFVVRMDEFQLTPELAALLPDDVRSVLEDVTTERLLSTQADGLSIDAPGTGTVTLRGAVDFVVEEDTPVGDGPIGALRLDPISIRTDPLGPLLAGFVRLEGFGIDVGLELRDLEGTIALDRLRLGDEPHGSGRLVDVKGRIEDIQVEGLNAPLLWQDGIFRMDPITGRLAGGNLTADFRIHTREPMAYEGTLLVEGFDVARVKDDLAPTGPTVTGVGRAEMRFQNRGGGIEHLTAEGALHIHDGNLGELPVVANIFAFFAQALDTQERPTFERADIDFRLRDEVITFSRADLAGPLFDMKGTGTLDLSLMANLRFTPHFITSMLLPGALQLPVLGDILDAIVREEILYDIRVRGPLDSASVDLIAVPWTGIDFSDSFEGTGPRELPKRRVPRWFR